MKKIKKVKTNYYIIQMQNMSFSFFIFFEIILFIKIEIKQYRYINIINNS